EFGPIVGRLFRRFLARRISILWIVVVGFLQITVRCFLGAASVVVGLLRLAVFVDGTFALAERIEDHSEVDVAPNFSPFLGWFGNGLQSVAKCVGGRLVVLLIEKRLAHPEVCQGTTRLNRKRTLVFLDRVEIMARLGQLFAARNCGPRAEGIIALQD